MLKEFVVVSWHGHTGDAGIPAVVNEVWEAKRRPGVGPGSNVDACVLDAAGKLVSWWNAMAPRPAGGRGGGMQGDALVRHWKDSLGEARRSLGLGAAGEARPVVLPGLPDGADSGVRVFTRLDDPGMPAYNAPVVELVAMGADAWKPLARPAKAGTVDAAACLPWLSKMFPGGVMERTDPDTKKVYEITGATGTLTLEPAGSAGESRFALLRGRVTLTDSGGGGFSFSGELQVVVEFRGNAAVPASLRGVFEGRYPRKGPQGSGGFEFDLTGVFEGVFAEGKDRR
ncbi:MAG: hypothetical protein HUU15_15300 [Candidatus Brocadiae bacterium]|nr:hypothetical protein [Candidatus Brocadiia bacterium]